MNYRECPHGIVVGTCNFCMAEQLKREQAWIERIRGDVALRERLEAERRFKEGKGK